MKRTTIIRIALMGALLPTCWALCSSIKANKVQSNYRRDNAFIAVTRIIEQDRPELWAKITKSQAYQDFAVAYDHGDAGQQADDLVFLVEYEDPSYVADCLSGTD